MFLNIKSFLFLFIFSHFLFFFLKSYPCVCLSNPSTLTEYDTTQFLSGF